MKKNEQNNIKVDKCRFIGSSHVNEVMYIRSDGTKFKCTQDDFIEALVKSKRHIKGGEKINLGSDSSRVSYLIDYGNKENEPQEMIKVTFDKKYLLSGDSTALAVDYLCQYAVNVRKNNIKKKVLSGVAMVLVTAGLVGTAVGLSYSEMEKNKYERDASKDIVYETSNEELHSGLENLIFEDDINSRSR